MLSQASPLPGPSSPSLNLGVDVRWKGHSLPTAAKLQQGACASTNQGKTRLTPSQRSPPFSLGPTGGRSELGSLQQKKQKPSMPVATLPRTPEGGFLVSAGRPPRAHSSRMTTNSEPGPEEALIKRYPLVTHVPLSPEGAHSSHDLFLPLPASVTGNHFRWN